MKKPASAAEPQMKYTGTATIIQHCAFMGEVKTVVRWFAVSQLSTRTDPLLYDRPPSYSVRIGFMRSRERTKLSIEVRNDNTHYVSIEDEAGRQLYDSRKNVPCDMEKWQAAKEQMGGHCAFSSEHYSTTETP